MGKNEGTDVDYVLDELNSLNKRLSTMANESTQRELSDGTAALRQPSTGRSRKIFRLQFILCIVLG